MSATVPAPEPDDRIVLEGARDGHALSITIHYAAIRELRALVTNRLEVASGFLVGELTEDRIVIAHCATERPKAPPIGVFRTQPAGWPAITEPDCKRIQAAMPAANAGVLMVARTLAQRPWSAALFLVHPKQPAAAEPALLEFPADEYLLRNGWLTDLTPPAAPPVFARGFAPPPRRRRWVALTAATLAIAGAAGAAYEAEWRPWSRSPADISAAADAKPVVAPPIGLSATRSLDELELSWNRSSDLVRAATGATLVIRNGAVTRMVPVSTDLLRGGRIMYHPLSGVDVDFRLELNLPGGRTEAESIRVLGFDTAPSLTLPVPAAPRPKPRAADQSADRSDVAPRAMTTLANPTEPLPVRRVTPVLTREVVEERRSANGPVTISVLVSIDAAGKVDSAKIVGATGEPSPSRSQMRLAALNAAQQWRFRPATAGGRPVPSTLTLSFSF